MRKKIILIIFVIAFITLISSSVLASQGIDGGDECSGERGKSEFCCSIDHSGSRGDCEDLVINDVEHKCAFVEDINECEKLPINWKPAEETEVEGKICPLEYEWLDDSLNCEAKIIKNKNDDNQNIIINDKQQNPNINLIIGFSTIIIILLIVIWFFLIKRRQK